jgi:hypothetical protein
VLQVQPDSRGALYQPIVIYVLLRDSALLRSTSTPTRSASLAKVGVPCAPVLKQWTYRIIIINMLMPALMTAPLSSLSSLL